jgi:hypothetical protein
MSPIIRGVFMRLSSVATLAIMASDSSSATLAEMERVQAVVERYCSCGWLSPFRVGKPDCDAHALFGKQLTLSRLINGFRMRSRLLQEEFGDVRP